MIRKLTLGALAVSATAISLSATSLSVAQGNRTAFFCDLGGGRQPHVVVSPFFKTIAFAQRSMRNHPIIVFNPNVTRNFASHRQTVIFTFLHECAHHVLHHTSLDPAKRQGLPQPKEREKAADCYAIQHMMHRGLLTRQGLGHIIRDVGKLPEDPSHPAGVVRGRYVVECIKAYRQYMYGRGGRGGGGNYGNR